MCSGCWCNKFRTCISREESVVYKLQAYIHTHHFIQTNTSRLHHGIESCPAALCDNPVDIGNGMVTFNGNSIGDVATYTCNVGFELIGNGTATCTQVDMDRAEFQPAPPSCRREYID